MELGITGGREAIGWNGVKLDQDARNAASGSPRHRMRMEPSASTWRLWTRRSIRTSAEPLGFFQSANSRGQEFKTMLNNAGTSSTNGIVALAQKSNSSVENIWLLCRIRHSTHNVECRTKTSTPELLGAACERLETR